MKATKDISLADIKELIENSVPESKTIDYKEALSLESEQDKREFLFDIASFANSSGGDIIVGIRQDKETGFPSEIVGCTQNVDQLQLQIDSIIRDGLEPRLTGVTLASIATDENKDLMIIRVPKSWHGPHMVIYKGSDRFYSRGNNGKYKLDVFELRNAFLASDFLRQRILNFRNERLLNILSKQGALGLLENGKIVLHIIPFASFGPSDPVLDLKSILNDEELLRPLGEQGFSKRYNFDGLLSSVERGSDKYAYMQLFRNGIIESVNSRIIQPSNGHKELYINTIEDFVLKFTERARRIYERLKMQPPMIAFLTMSGVADYVRALEGWFDAANESRVDKDALAFSDILIEDWSIDTDVLLKPWFDSLWNAVGIDESKSYRDRRWVKRR